MFYRVFLDTNIYDGAAYSFRNTLFQKMREYASQGKLVLVSNSVINGEVRAHIESNIKEAVQEFNTLVKKNRFFASFRKLPEFKEIVARQDISMWVDACLAEYESFLRDCDVENISVSEIDIDKMIADYFQQKPPFEAKKPDEFKDAIAVASLLLDIDRTFDTAQRGKPVNVVGEDITYCVVSNDKGFREAVLANCSPPYLENVKVFKELKDFIDYTLRMDVRARFLRAFLLSEYSVEEMEETIQQVVLSASLDIDLGSGEIVDEMDIVGISDIKYMPYILGIYEEDGRPLTAKVLLEVYCNTTAWYSYTDEDNSFYDKEEGAYLWKNVVAKEGLYQIDFETVVSLGIENCMPPETWSIEDGAFDFRDKSAEFQDYLEMPSVIKLSEDNLLDEELLSEDELMKCRAADCGRR